MTMKLPDRQKNLRKLTDDVLDMTDWGLQQYFGGLVHDPDQVVGGDLGVSCTGCSTASAAATTAPPPTSPPTSPHTRKPA